MGSAFDYSGLSQEHQAKLRRIANHIHTIGCRQTAEAVEMGENFIKAKIGLEYGQFSNWCTSEAGYRIRKVQLLMSLANFAGKAGLDKRRWDLAGAEANAVGERGEVWHIKTIPAFQMMLEDFQDGRYAGVSTIVVHCTGGMDSDLQEVASVNWLAVEVVAKASGFFL